MNRIPLKTVKAALTLMLTFSAGMSIWGQELKPIAAEEIAKITAIIPENLPAKSKKRKILVFWRCEGYVHGSAIEYGLEAFKQLQAKHSNYSFDFSREYKDLAAANLKKYDALVLDNTTHINTKDNFALEYDLIDYVKSGKGLAVIHAGADSFYEAEAAAEMVGGRFWGHPWGAKGVWAFKLDEPDHPINQSFGGKNFKWGDEIYQQQSPFYNRAKLRVLISLDLSDETTAKASGQKRDDGDYAVSWIRSYGQGRVFYTSFAHDQRTYLDRAIFTHIIAGLQYTLGDLKVDDAPPGISTKDLSLVKSADAITVNTAFALMQDIIRNTNDEKVNKSNIAKITALLVDNTASPFAKQAVLRTLLDCGVAADVESVVACLAQQETQDWAVTLLAGTQSKAAAKALEKALASSQGASRVTVINALVIQKNQAAIASMLTDSDRDVVVAALSGLGRIGDKDAVQTLLNYSNPDFSDIRNTALAAGIGAMALSGNSKTAAKIAALIMQEENSPAPLRAACAKAQLIHDPAYFISGMQDQCPMVKATLIRNADQVPNTVLAAAMATASPEFQSAIITKLASKNSKESAPAIARMLSSNSPELVCAALKALSKLGSADQIAAMYAGLSDENPAIKTSAEMALNNMQCQETSAKLFEIAGNDIERQKSVLKILGERTIAADLPSYTPYINSKDDGVRQEAWKAAGKTADESTYQQLIAWLPSVQQSEINQASSAIRASLRNVEPAQVKVALLKAWESATAPAKSTLINLLSQYSDDAYIPVIGKAMSDPDQNVAENAIRTLGTWSNIKPYDELVRVLKTEADTNLKKIVYRSALKLAMSCGGKDTDQMCADLFKNAPTDQEREMLVTLHFKENGIKTFKLLQKNFDDANCGAMAKQLYVKLYDEKIKPVGNVAGKGLDPKDWKASASSGQGEVNNAFDRNPDSRWTTGPSQKGMWFAIDLGKPSFISEILLDTEKSASDTPNGYEVFLSNDGKNWETPIAKGDGSSRSKTTISLAANGRHIKIVLLDGRPKLHWSIHEIYIKAGIDKSLVNEIKTTADSLR